MKLDNVQYDEMLEDTDSQQFQNLAGNLEAIVSLTPKEDYFPIFAPFLSSTLFIVNYFEPSITLISLLSLRISCGCCWHHGNAFLKKNFNAPPSAQKLLKAHLCGWNKTLYIPLVIPSTAFPIIGGSGDVCSTT